jgi:predicted AlkP superfamily phosphohydrolase/phosphomutase
MNSGIDGPLLVLCIEVADPDLVDRWCREGHLPNLERLRRLGSWSRLQSTNDISSGCIWPSFNTGTNPAKHGMTFHHMQLVSGTYHIDKFSADQVGRDPFWRYLNEAGKRCAIVDAPVTCPLPDFKGIQVFGWGVEAPERHRSSDPPEVIDALLNEIGRHPLADESDRRRFIRPVTREEHADVAEALLEGVELKGRLLRWLWKQGPWDMLLGVFGESHWADHVMYQVLDPSHPDHNPEYTEETDGLFLRLYQAHDTAIGKLLAEAPGATVVVFAGSGMRPTYSGNHLLPAVLKRLGLGPESETLNEEPDSSSDTSETSEDAKEWAFYRIRWLQDAIPGPVVTAARQLVPNRLWEKLTRRIAFAGSGWSESQAFALINDFSGNIRINLQGREPSGIVAAEDYDTVCDELALQLLELVNVETGKRAVERVIKVREEYEGDRIDALPDLAVVWSAEAPINGLRSSRIGTVRGVNPERRPGGHHPDAFVILSGPGVEEGRVLEGAHLLDLAPTLFRLMDVPIPSDFDGGVLEAALESPGAALEGPEAAQGENPAREIAYAPESESTQ